MPAVLQLDNVTRRFGHRTVLAGVSLSVGPGEVHALVGPNGSGKSTLARLAVGLLRPHVGTVRVGSSDPRHSAEARRLVGYVGHASLLYGDLSALDNLRFVGRLYRLAFGEQAISAAFDAVGVGVERSVPVRSLSRGMTQRVALARSLLHTPALLMWDEPFAGLDTVSVTRAIGALESARARGAAVVVISHDLAELWRLETLVHVVHRGAIRLAANTSMPLDLFRSRYAEATND